MKKVFLIRIALILGVATFAGLTAVLQMTNRLPAPDAETLKQLTVYRYIAWGLGAFALGWAYVWKQRVESAMTENAMNSALIVGWAPGESAALFGIVTHFLGGPIATMALGILVFIVVLLILRIPTPPR